MIDPAIGDDLNRDGDNRPVPAPSPAPQLSFTDALKAATTTIKQNNLERWSNITAKEATQVVQSLLLDFAQNHLCYSPLTEDDLNQQSSGSTPPGP